MQKRNLCYHLKPPTKINSKLIIDLIIWLTKTINTWEETIVERLQSYGINKLFKILQRKQAHKRKKKDPIKIKTFVLQNRPLKN